MIMKINPDLRQAKHLRIWYDAGGHSTNNQITTSRPVSESLILAKWKTIGQIENEKLGRQNHADYVMIKATCMHIANDRVVYMVCCNCFFSY